MARHADLFAERLRPALADEHIHIVTWDSLSDNEKHRLHEIFAERVFPVLTPLAVDPAHPFPYISGLSLNLAVVVRNPTTDTEHFARVKVPPLLPRFVEVEPDAVDPELAASGTHHVRTTRFVGLEDLIAVHLDQLFPGMEVLEHKTFRVTRNEDLEVEEDDAENLLQALEKELLRRRFGPPVRLELSEDVGDRVRDLLVRELGVNDSEVYTLPEPLDLRGLGTVADVDRGDLHYPKFVPKTHPHLTDGRETAKPSNIFAAIRKGDVLLHHPYDSFSTSVQAFLEQAATDKRVLAIKQTLYRTSGDSPIVDALIDAADAGKQVLALVEIKARFDEQANISLGAQAGAGRRARRLRHRGPEDAREAVAWWCARSPTASSATATSGPGNYNPKTARLYEDLGLLTCDAAVGEDLTRLFNQLSGYAPKTAYRRLLVAPRSLRTGLLQRIDAGGRAPRGRAPGAGADQGELDGRRAGHRRALPGLHRGRAGRRRRPRHLRAAARGARPVGEHPGALGARPLPRALADLLVRRRRRAGHLHRQRGHDAPQPRPPGRGAGAHHRPQPPGRARRAGRPLDGPGHRLLAPRRGRPVDPPPPRAGRRAPARPAGHRHRAALVPAHVAATVMTAPTAGGR